MPPKSVTEKGEVSGMLPAWRSPKVSDTSPAVVPNLIIVAPILLPLAEVVPHSCPATMLPCRHVSSSSPCRGSSDR